MDKEFRHLGKQEIEKRAEELMKQMSLRQKIAQLQCCMTIGKELDASQFPDGLGVANIGLVGMTREQQAITMEENIRAVAENALGIPPIIHTESLTGLGTIFPSAIGLGASFDPALVEEAAAVIHDEAREWDISRHWLRFWMSAGIPAGVEWAKPMGKIPHCAP